MIYLENKSNITNVKAVTAPCNKAVSNRLVLL